MQSRPAKSSLENLLRQEGWSLHQRLSWAIAQPMPLGSTEQRNEALQSWRQVVAPDNPASFDKRLAWDGLTPKSAAWALQPDATSCPQDPPWWPLLVALRQAPP